MAGTHYARFGSSIRSVLTDNGTCFRHWLWAVKSVEVEGWLHNFKKINGQPASPATETKIRNLMSVSFSHAIRREWATKNPISAVRTSAKRLRTPDILTGDEVQRLLLELSQRERVMVLLAGSTGLRRGAYRFSPEGYRFCGHAGECDSFSLAQR